MTIALRSIATPTTWSSDKKLDFRPNFGDSLLYEHHTTSLVFNDPPYHTPGAQAFGAGFHAARACARCRHRVEELVDHFLTTAAETRRD